MKAVTGPQLDESKRPAWTERRRRWVRLSRTLRPVVVIIQLVYYAIRVGREL